MTISRDDVRGAYRFILGREPESEEVVARHQANHSSLDALRLTFFSSEEFQRHKLRVPPQPRVPLTAPPQVIETTVDPATLRAIVAKTAAAWEAVGKTAPHHSVLSVEQYTPDRLPENENSFFESGKLDLDLLLALLRRIGRPPEGFNRCLEFGCGIGRVTAYLAAIFPEVIALDISRPHLKLAQAHLTRLDHGNVSFLQVTPEDPHPGTGYDLWFSRLVLQHNPPPVTLDILNRMFVGLAPGGVAVVHVPTYHDGYSFNIADYITDKSRYMHMHVTPQKPILELAWHNGCCLLDIREEPVPGWLTNIFVFQKTETSRLV